MSLKSVYQNLRERDHEKVAQHRAAQGLPPDLSQVDPTLLKQAQDYDHIGRILAHNVFCDLVKEALDEAGVPADKQDAELARILAGGDKKKDEKKDGEGDDDKKDDSSSSEGEKKEAAKMKLNAKKKILAKMARDPSYVSQLIAKHSGR